MREIRALSATGMLGTGYSAESLDRAMQWQPHFIGVDAGSSDWGPFYLGSGRTQASHGATKRDLRLLLKAGRAANIPVIVGSAGTSGGEPHLAFTRQIVEEIAQEEGLHFRMALIHAEIDKDYLTDKLGNGKIHPLHPAPSIDTSTIQRASRIVGQMGAEPFMAALQAGAEVIIAGRASDTSIYAALPLLEGLAPGPVWHAAKILECGAASVEQRLHPDCLMAWIRDDEFIVEPPHPGMRCTPTSVVAHTLYENADPYRLVEPSGTLDTRSATYEHSSDRAVRVRGSKFEPANRYTVRLEATEYLGHRYSLIAGIRDPMVLRQLDPFLAGLRTRINEKVIASLGLTMDRDYQMVYRIYGKDGSMGSLEPTPQVTGHEVGLVLEVIAPDAAKARDILTIAGHTGLHHPIPEWHGLISNFAFPYSPPEMDAGPVYRFSMNHVLELDDPMEPFRVELVEVGTPALAGAAGNR
ncbi:MAG: acyclic terpene utilization AtuA family protein [Chloroflexota bacterium]